MALISPVTIESPPPACATAASALALTFRNSSHGSRAPSAALTRAKKDRSEGVSCARQGERQAGGGGGGSSGVAARDAFGRIHRSPANHRHHVHSGGSIVARRCCHP